MSVTGGCGFGSCTYDEMAQTEVGGITGAVMFFLDEVKALSDVIFREFWIYVERNTVEGTALRASILTVTKSESYRRLWFDGAGWHEDLLRAGGILPAPTYHWAH